MILPPSPPAIHAPAHASSSSSITGFGTLVSTPTLGLVLLAPGSNVHISALLSPKSPSASKGATLIVTLSDLGKPMSRAKVTADIYMTDMDMGTTLVVLKPIGGGKWEGAVSFSMGGPWAIKLKVKPFVGNVVTQTIPVKVAD